MAAIGDVIGRGVAGGGVTGTAGRNDWATVAALGLLAMCVVTFDHEALGHGSACLLLGGQIRLLTSSIFHCDVRSGWIDPAGPACNLLMGAIALACRRLVPQRLAKLRLFLILVTAFSLFWEAGYLMRAMLRRDGDLYFFVRFLLGEVTAWERWAAAAAGLVLYVAAIRITSAGLSGLWPEAPMARAAARAAWLSATLGAAAAALAFPGPDWADVRDAALEIGGASLPLLVIPVRGAKNVGDAAPALIARSPVVIGLSVVVYVLFVATLGRGLAF